MRHHWAAVGCEIELGWVGYRGMALRLEVRLLEAVGLQDWACTKCHYVHHLQSSSGCPAPGLSNCLLSDTLIIPVKSPFIAACKARDMGLV